MASGSFNLTRTGGTSSYITFTLNWVQIGNTSTNASDVQVNIVASKSSSSSQPTYGTYNASVSIASKTATVGDTSFSLSPGSSITLLSKTITGISHNADGTLSPTIVGNVGGNVMYANGSENVTFDTLHKPPEIGVATMVETNSALTALSVPDTTIVRYLSKKTITLNATTSDGAAKTYRLRHLNTNYALPSSSTYQSSNVFNTDYTTHDVAIGDGKANLIQDIKDSLNGTATDWVQVDINGTIQKPNGIAYTKPTIEKTNTTIKRKSGGGVNLTDNKAVLNLKAKIYKTTSNVIGSNNNIQQIGYKIWEQGGSEPSSYTSLTSTIDSSGNVTISNLEITNKDYTKTYNYKIILKDRFGYQDIITGTLPTGQSVWTEYKDRVDFLKLTIGGNSIIDSGSNSNGNYIKYYDGTMICYKTLTREVAMTTAWGSLYEGSMQLGNWSQNFISTPNVQVTNIGTSGAMIECFDVAPTTTSAGTVFLARAISYTVDVTVNVVGIGKWK